MNLCNQISCALPAATKKFTALLTATTSNEQIRSMAASVGALIAASGIAGYILGTFSSAFAASVTLMGVSLFAGGLTGNVVLIAIPVIAAVGIIVKLSVYPPIQKGAFIIKPPVLRTSAA